MPEVEEATMPTGDLEHRVPRPHDRIDEIQRGVEDILDALFGARKAGADPGLVQVVAELSTKIGQLESQVAKAEAARLTWKNGLGLAAAGAALTQAGAWLVATVKGPH